ncbi:MAG: S24 family peptidase [Vampirovibrionales bacterium]|nr:S24 family peptidase [Vampirovibrionales bacterium]
MATASKRTAVDVFQSGDAALAWEANDLATLLTPLSHHRLDLRTLSSHQTPQPPQTLAVDYQVPLILASAHAGIGGLIDDEYIQGTMGVPKQWFKGIGQSLIPKCFLTQVVGDSMEQSAPEGSYLLAAPSSLAEEQQHHRPVLVQFDGKLSVKRLQQHPKTHHLSLVSENPKYPPHRIDPLSIEFVWRVLEVLVEFR